MTDPSTEPDIEFPRAIGQPASRALGLAGITRYEELVNVSAAELLQLHGVGPKAIRLLRGELTLRGLAFDGE
ncbi:helix-hairpin-helix domain-containing protein [Arthrobacter sp. HLT1-20]